MPTIFDLSTVDNPMMTCSMTLLTIYTMCDDMLKGLCRTVQDILTCPPLHRPGAWCTAGPN
eukprot:scaffold184751_cov50-Prasinocladus_malaysianus.AAC.1